MTTPNDICTQALKKSGVLGVGQTPLAEDINDAFTDLNEMLAQWTQNRWLVYHLVDYSFTSTGALNYTVGPGGNFNVAYAPRRLEAAYFRQLINAMPNQVDYPLEILNAREDYSNITLKQLQTFPKYIFLDSNVPTALVYPWPVIPANLYELHIVIKELLPQFANLAVTVVLPQEYFAALKWNLALRLRESYQLPERPSLSKLAKDSLNVIRKANNQMPRMKMPKRLMNRQNYNVYDDQPY